MIQDKEINSGMEINNDSSKYKFRRLNRYFFEFLMIFLGVTAGFFVDEFRQARGERAEEIDYIKSYLRDLEKDRIQLEYNSKFGKISILGHDSLSRELTKKPLKGREKKLYHFYNLQNTGFGFPHHDRTMTQLKYAGKFRIIQNQAVAEALVDYDSKLTAALAGVLGIYKMNISNNTLIDIARVFDLTQAYQFADKSLAHINDLDKVHYPSDLRLLNYDESVIMQLRNTLIQSRAIDEYFLKENNEILKVNKALDSLIRKEYF